MDEITSVFVTESREQLAALEAALLQLESDPSDSDTLNAIFRSAHTIKGGAGVVECDFIVRFTHVVENALDKLRDGDIQLNADLTALLLACADHIGSLLDTLEAGATEPDAELSATGATLLARLQRDWLDGKQVESTSKAGPPSPREEPVHSSGGGAVETDCWHISLRFGPEVLRNGMDPLALLRYLTTLGQIVRMTTIADAMPETDAMDPEACYLGFEISFASSADKAAIERVFDFVRDDCTLHILPPHSKLEDYVGLVQALPEDTMRLGEILVAIGALTQSELDAGLLAQQQANDSPEIEDDEEPAPPTPLGEILVEQHVVQPELIDAVVGKQKKVSDKMAADSRLIRIQADKLDALIDLVGELVIAGASVHLLAGKSGQSDLIEATSLSSRLVESIRDAALQLRMVQIGETFNRFNRVVRDSSRELGKTIELDITGADTELDKSVVEKLGDPLMHLVRNAIDHGVESPEVRAASGKPVIGRIGLNAFHDSGSIVIEVTDDGAGLPRDKIRRKAIERGLIDENANLSDHEIVSLIFEAGFSTADQVTNISGRGVGMDVVRRNIQALRGTVDVRTNQGQGSTFAIRLPLTLAIIDGFLTGVGSANYVVPLDSVVECIELQDVNAERNFLNLRGEVLPFVRLREMFEIGGPVPTRQNVVVVQYAGRKAGLVVDALLGEFQTVIKPLGALFRNIRGIGGSTILGTGEVALILDVPALIQLVSGVEEGRLHAPQRRELGVS